MKNKKKTIDNLEKNWVANEINIQACIDFWNMFASNQNDITIPTPEDNDFIRLITDEGMCNIDGNCLDIGSGTGRYSFALSKYFKHLVGIDLSNEMVKKAHDLSNELNINNVEFVCSHWDEINLKKLDYYKKFDLVFAHMTPAINSLETFEKIINASKGYCIMSKPTKRFDPILDKIMKKLSITGFNFSAEDDIKNAFDYLWSMGFCPKLYYENKVYTSRKSISNASKMYINRIKQFANIYGEDEKKITDIVKSFAVNGEIIEEMSMMITTIYWHV